MDIVVQIIMAIFYVMIIAFITSIFFLPFSIIKMEQHLKRIADAMEKFLKEGR